MIYRCILAKWAQTPSSRRVWEGEFSEERLRELNAAAYNIYFLPNQPSQYTRGRAVEGADIDKFHYVFVDFDLKSGAYPDKESFIKAVYDAGPSLDPTSVIDSGNGVHVYWEVSDLDAMSYLRLQRRLRAKFNTDPAVAQIYQLMRLPGTLNTKEKGNFKPCTQVYASEAVYTCEQIASQCPPLSQEDEDHCLQHYNKTYRQDKDKLAVDDTLPPKFAKLLRSSPEVKDIWAGNVDDRSKADYRLGHILFASGFSRAEALSVLVNAAKALERAPVHRMGYAENIVDKIWTFEDDAGSASLSSSVRDILLKRNGAPKGTRFPCWSYIDNTEHGFRLGQVIGLVAGAKVGKTAMSLNMFQGFVQSNPDYTHFIVPLEQPEEELADIWQRMCGDNTALYDKVQVLSNYGPDGGYRNLSLEEIKDYLQTWQKTTGRKIGCVVIDHIGVLKKSSTDGRQSIEDICHAMKAFAVQLNVLLIMQSQAPREKAGIGDIELNKDAAYGTVFFESYCDYMIGIWQPLKRCYENKACPSVTAFKFCAIRHKSRNKDIIQEDVCYRLFFDADTGNMRELTQDEEKAFDFFNKQAANRRKKAIKRDGVIPYVSARWATKEQPNGATSNHTDPTAA